MNYINYSKRLKYLLKGQIDSPQIIAKKFNCCDKTARNMINRLRETGQEIEYCKTTKKYVKITDGNFFTV